MTNKEKIAKLHRDAQKIHFRFEELEAIILDLVKDKDTNKVYLPDVIHAMACFCAGMMSKSFDVYDVDSKDECREMANLYAKVYEDYISHEIERRTAGEKLAPVQLH